MYMYIIIAVLPEVDDGLAGGHHDLHVTIHSRVITWTECYSTV